MRSHIRHQLNNPLRLTIKAVALFLLIAGIAHGAFAQGVNHAITVARPMMENDAVLIDFDGQIHEYR